MQLKLSNFEGPIDLLYNLIDERKLDICQISLSEVADQYLAHIKNYQEVNPQNLAGFLVVAARLILIKSRMLLPSLEISKEEEEEIDELQKKLELYKKLREITKKLKDFSKHASPTFSREFLISQHTVFLPPKDLTKDSLGDHLSNLLAKIPKPTSLPQKTIKAIISFEEIIKNLHHRIQNAIYKTFSQAVGATSSRMEVIVHFLALLELVKQKHISAEQTENFGEIALGRYNDN